MNDPDAELMLTFCRGQEDAFVELYRRYRDRIVAFCRRIVGTDAQAEEAAQDVFIKLYRARDGYTQRSRFSTFIYRIAANHCLNLQARVEHKHLVRGVEIDARPAPRPRSTRPPRTRRSSKASCASTCRGRSRRCPTGSARRSCSSTTKASATKRRPRRST